jgi:signal transduction histidine kinase/HPt (histidine-containing phosphotransfer) domain-containing protein
MFAGKLILTIDDSDTIRSYLKSVLSPLGAKVEGAATGQEGLDRCADTQYDLILLDLILPDSDGIEVLQRIREKNSASAIVMLTGHGGIRSAITAVQLGADGYLEKQEMTATARDHTEFLYALEQALDHRAGLTAQQQLEAMRADFYSMVTHDLRNPAGTVQAALEMLEEDNTGSLTPSQRELLSVARYAVSKMLHLINDYLDYAKIDAGYLRLDQKDVELRQVVEESARLSMLQARARRQTLTLDLPPEPVWAFADGERLRQVLDNLLSNASKYTREKGKLTVQLRVEGDQAVFRVSDTGVGILPEQLPVLFTKYHRVPGEATRGIRGTGLGLLIVKEIVGAHGGSIHAESEGVPGKGATFVFNIPLKPAVVSPEPTESSAQPTPPPAPESEPASPDVENAELYQTFMQEAQKHIHILQDIFNQLYDKPDDRQLIEVAQRTAHTLKGNAGAMQFSLVCDLATQMDDVLRQAARGDLALTLDQVADLERLLGQLDFALATE